MTLEQISYAARDAWVSAAILEQLQKGNSDIFQAGALIEMEFMKTQRGMDVMDVRATLRKAAKVELKEIVERQKDDAVEKEDNEEERKLELRGLLDLHRPDQPPTFNGEVVLFNYSNF